MSSNDVKFETLFTTFTEAAEFKLLLKNPCCDTPEKRARVEEFITSLKAKPKVWLHKTKISEKGGFVFPVAIYLDGDGGTTAIDHLIGLLEEYKTNPLAKPYVKS